MQDFEKLGAFYLGRPYDPAKKKPKPGWLLYDSKDLVTHAVCVGMTGSGKTGLCIGLLEEAAIDGIPAIVIDPKGDLPNLLLTFPDLAARDFAPWINEDDARKKGLSPADYAAQQADLWQKGLAEWGQDGARIGRLRAAAECAIYTPGSRAGLPVSILKSFAAPGQGLLDDPELLRERIATTVTGLLGLLGLDADPIKSREHILISTILHAAWTHHRDLDLAALIQQIQTPPLARIGVLDLETFYPSKDRFALAMQLNNLLAAPGFSTWLEGEPLDIQSLLYTSAGKPRIAIFSIAHLSDAERMFFVSLLLNQTLGWVRTQPGTSTLRAIVYMDEIYGYVPPVANPPSKAPLLTLLKQARAFGVGIVLATQNPVDLDYKGLANTGTWFIGRLQTERDKARVLDGLEGATAGAGQTFDRRRMEQILAGLGSRIFLMNNVHEDASVVFQTRWTLSYLRGPLTRAQIKQLMGTRMQDVQGTTTSEVDSQPSSLERLSSPAPSLASRPMLPPDVHQYFIPVHKSQPAGASLLYRPMVVGFADVRFVDAKKAIDLTRVIQVLAPITGGPMSVEWEDAEEAAFAVSDLEQAPHEGARFADLPSVAGNAKSYDAWAKDFAAWVYRTQTVDLFKSPSVNERSTPGESERDFRVRLQQKARERRDAAADALRRTYAPKLSALQERKRRAEQTLEREAEQATQSGIQAAISVGATLLGAFMGRKALSASTLGKATTAVRGAGRILKDRKDVGRAQETVAAIDQRISELEAQFTSDVASLDAVGDPLAERLETVSLKPSKSNIAVKLVALAWTPYWQDAGTNRTPAYR